ncbi:MAG: hypothetical protein IPF92_13635 [Myxococcales bacterium]|nr:hypothetical protein [Myxococcales bacterium]MBL0194915.1 hypothetical protein [Myxococcales bacterium]HQY61218.1 hypothetical protein [Polyangiaceae bacterium]
MSPCQPEPHTSTPAPARKSTPEAPEPPPTRREGRPRGVSTMECAFALATGALLAAGALKAIRPKVAQASSARGHF